MIRHIPEGFEESKNYPEWYGKLDGTRLFYISDYRDDLGNGHIQELWLPAECQTLESAIDYVVKNGVGYGQI